MHRKTFISTVAALSLTAALAIGLTAARQPAGPARFPTCLPEKFSSCPPERSLSVRTAFCSLVIPLAAPSSPSIPKTRKAVSSAPKVNIQGIDEKIAAAVGVTPDQIVINDVKVNPVSKNVYLSGSRGRGPDAMPLIVRSTRPARSPPCRSTTPSMPRSTWPTRRHRIPPARPESRAC